MALTLVFLLSEVIYNSVETDKDETKAKQRERCMGDSEMGKNTKKFGSLHGSSCWESLSNEEKLMSE